MNNKKNKKALTHRIAISLPAADLEEIKKLSQQRALSVSEYARMLIRIGLLIEKNRAIDIGYSYSPLNQNQPSLLWKTLLSWELETRFLVRHLTEEWIQKNSPEHRALLETAKEKAQARVEELLQTFIT
jgi:hypothetical protein